MICVFELYDKAGNKNQYYIYAVPINDDFNGLEINIRGKRIRQLDTYSGFRLNKYNNNTLRCVIKYGVYDITIKINDKSVVTLSWTDKSYLLDSEADLFDYNNEFFFKSQKIEDIFSLQIYRPTITNYFTLNNYNENNIKKLMGYHIETSTGKDTIFIYQSQNYIKYFLLNSTQSFPDEIIIERVCDENEALIRDSNNHICYPITQNIKGFKYDVGTNYFEKCYASCSFCSEISTDSSNHKCESCIDDYLPSYKYLKNCYNKNGIEDIEDKKVENQNGVNFVITNCSLYKIGSTGECVEACPEMTDYYLYEYDSNSEQYIKSILNPPKYLFNKKCIEECPLNSISNENNECICQYAFYIENNETTCLSDDNCIDDYPYKNPHTKKCYSSLDDYFNNINLSSTYINNNIYNNQSLINNYKDYFNNLVINSKNNLNDKDNKIIINIKNLLKNGDLNIFVSNIIEKEKKDIIIKDNNIIYQLTSSDNQNNNISSIKLGKCESELKLYYNISNSTPLLIIKTDIYENGLLMPIIEYEIYNIETKELLDLNICKDIKLHINIPVNINESNLFKYNSSSEYYNDICYSFTTENNTDIILKDRRNEFINNNMSLCENNCNYNAYNKNTQKVLCECNIKIKFPIISEIEINQNKLLNNFKDIGSTLNINIIKCYSNIFKKEGIINNIGNYVISIIIIFTIIYYVYYLK